MAHDPVKKAVSGLTAEERTKIIPSIVREEQISLAIASPCGRVNLMSGGVTHLGAYIDRLHRHGKAVYVHVEMIEGLGRDEEAVKFVLEDLHADGVIATKNLLIVKANELQRPSIQRIFAIDTAAVRTSFKTIQKNDPAEIELMPGLMPQMIGLVRKRFPRKTLITGGLIHTWGQAEAALHSGADYISTGAQELWAPAP